MPRGASHRSNVSHGAQLSYRSRCTRFLSLPIFMVCESDKRNLVWIFSCRAAQGVWLGWIACILDLDQDKKFQSRIPRLDSRYLSLWENPKPLVRPNYNAVKIDLILWHFFVSVGSELVNHYVCTQFHFYVIHNAEAKMNLARLLNCIPQVMCMLRMSKFKVVDSVSQITKQAVLWQITENVD